MRSFTQKRFVISIEAQSMLIALLKLTTLLSLSAAAIAGDSVSTQAETQSPWWLGHALTGLGTLIAALMIVYQLGRQHKNEIRLQTENFKGQLKLQVYQEFSARLASAGGALGNASMYVFTGIPHIEIFLAQTQQGINPNPIDDRALIFMQKNAEAADEVVEVVFLIEKYFIVHPELDIFRLALASAAHEMWNAFHALFEFMLKHFPVEMQTMDGPRPENVKVFSADQVAEHRTLAKKYVGAIDEADCYLMDMRTELQMLLLSGLFPHVMPRRRPADPNLKVISLDPASVKSLRQHFWKNTEWGRRAVGTKMDVHREFHGRI